MSEPDRPRGTRVPQAERRERTRVALLAAAARGLSRFGYGNLALEWVATEAGYTRGALYHQFRDKQELTLAVIGWARETWLQEVRPLVEGEQDPLAALLALARGHAVYCRRDMARMPIALRLEFSGQDHPLATTVEETYRDFVDQCAVLIEAARAAGSLPPGPTATILATAMVGALEGTVISLAGQIPHDELLAVRAVAGVLGVAAPPSS